MARKPRLGTPGNPRGGGRSQKPSFGFKRVVPGQGGGGDKLFRRSGGRTSANGGKDG